MISNADATIWFFIGVALGSIYTASAMKYLQRKREMTAYWIEFKDRPSGCVEADDETTALIAARLETSNKPVKATRIPYPAEPRIVKKLNKTEHYGDFYTPSFCSSPEKCKGHSCCPKSYSCTE